MIRDDNHYRRHRTVPIVSVLNMAGAKQSVAVPKLQQVRI